MIQACKGDRRRRRLDKDKKQGSKAKEEVCFFCEKHGNWLEGRACRNI
jgi:hypothetical protein